jgi:hypothetical protein
MGYTDIHQNSQVPHVSGLGVYDLHQGMPPSESMRCVRFTVLLQLPVLLPVLLLWLPSLHVVIPLLFMCVQDPAPTVNSIVNDAGRYSIFFGREERRGFRIIRIVVRTFAFDVAIAIAVRIAIARQEECRAPAWRTSPTWGR